MRTVAKELYWDHWGEWDNEKAAPGHRHRFYLSEETVFRILVEGINAGVYDVKKLGGYFEIAAWKTTAAVSDGIARNPVGLFRYLFRQQLNR